MNPISQTTSPHPILKQNPALRRLICFNFFLTLTSLTPMGWSQPPPVQTPTSTKGFGRTDVVNGEYCFYGTAEIVQARSEILGDLEITPSNLRYVRSNPQQALPENRTPRFESFPS